MMLRVERQRPAANAVLGQLFVDGVAQCLTLERADTITPAGIYPVTLTFSQRCCDRILWSPDDDPAYRDECAAWAEGLHRLLLVNDVPGHSGIRIHAANEIGELDGCTAVGTGRQLTKLTLSRRALAKVMNLVVPALTSPGAVTIEYRQAGPLVPHA